MSRYPGQHYKPSAAPVSSDDDPADMACFGFSILHTPSIDKPEPAHSRAEELVISSVLSAEEESYVKALYVSGNVEFESAEHVYAYSIDYDGCISNDGSDLLVDEIINDIIKKLEDDPKGVVVLLTGSFRQFISTDIHNMVNNRNGSCYAGMQALLAKLVEQHPGLKNRIALDPIILADIEREKKAGYFFRQALNRLNAGKYTPEDADGHSPKWHDDNKIAMHYLHMHRLKTCFDGKKVFYYHHDDKTNIMLESRNFFLLRQHYVPRDLKYQSRWYMVGQYYADEPDFSGDVQAPIDGVGDIDWKYFKKVQKIKEVPLDSALSDSFFNHISLDSPTHLNKLWKMLTDSSIDSKLYDFFENLISGRGVSGAVELVSRFSEEPKFASIKEKCFEYLLKLAIEKRDIEQIKFICARTRHQRYIFLSSPAESKNFYTVQAVYCPYYVDLLPHFLRKGLRDEEWRMLRQETINPPSIDELAPVLVQCIQMGRQYDVCRLISMHPGVNPALNDFVRKLMRSNYSKNDANSRSLICKLNFFEELFRQLLQVNSVSDEFAFEIIKLLAFEKIKKNADENISQHGLRALLFILYRETAKRVKSFEMVAFHLILRTLLASDEIQHVQSAATPGGKIKECCEHYIAYEAVARGKAKEELTNIEPVLKYVELRLSIAELRDINLQSSVQKYMHTDESAQSKLFVKQLAKVREQSARRQNNNNPCSLAFSVLLILLISERGQYTNETIMREMLAQWLSASNLYREDREGTNEVVLGDADNRLYCACCFFASTNKNFADTFVDGIVEACRELPSVNYSSLW